tara:strand:- start:1134 stop:1652 length:519 start_codon:yes stop_codon:yes gene_type:complete
MSEVINVKTGSVIYKDDALNFKDTVQAAVDNDVDLSLSNMRGKDLSGLNLAGAKLNGANLICANLTGSDCTGVEFTGANLSAAILKNATLSMAKLIGARTEYAVLPVLSIVANTNQGIPVFVNEYSTEVGGHEPMLTSEWGSMTDEVALDIGGVKLKDALPQIKLLINCFAK